MYCIFPKRGNIWFEKNLTYECSRWCRLINISFCQTIFYMGLSKHYFDQHIRLKFLIPEGQDLPPPLLGGPPNFIKSEKTLHMCTNGPRFRLNSYTDPPPTPPPPPFQNPVSAICVRHCWFGFPRAHLCLTQFQSGIQGFCENPLNHREQVPGSKNLFTARNFIFSARWWLWWWNNSF